MARRLLVLSLVLAVFVFDITVIQSINWLGPALQLTLLVVILIAATQGPIAGFLTAVIAGAMYSTTSILPWFIHPLAFLAAAAVAAFAIRRLFTTRSTASLLATVALGTATAGISIWILVSFARFFDTGVRHPDWGIFLLANILRFGVHPFLAWAWWRLFRANRLFTLGMINRTF